MAEAVSDTRDRWPRMMRRKTVAAYLDVSPATVDTLDLPSHTMANRSWRFWLRDDVDAWIDRQTGRTEVLDPSGYLEQWR